MIEYYNEMSKKAHEAAVAKGFWDERLSNEHCVMLIVTEIAELVEADRKNQRANCKIFSEVANISDVVFMNMFELNIKNTFEDEMADIAIRLLDLAGSIRLNFDKLAPCNYFRVFNNFSVTENAFALCRGLVRDGFYLHRKLLFGLNYVFSWAHELGIDLKWHIEQKMRYNSFRDKKHGKKY